jgi:hypothetical protein
MKVAGALGGVWLGKGEFKDSVKVAEDLGGVKGWVRFSEGSWGPRWGNGKAEVLRLIEGGCLSLDYSWVRLVFKTE